MRPDQTAGQRAREFFENLWSEKDPWDLETAELDQRRYGRQVEVLAAANHGVQATQAGRRYGRALELGCAGGSFTRHLSAVCDGIVAIDIAQRAVARAREAHDYACPVDFRVANIMEFDVAADGPWDLVVLTETAYYLGWLYPMFDVAWLAHSLWEATQPGGRLLLANTISGDYGLMSPWLIRTYRDLFANAGYDVEAEETISGVKETVHFHTPVTLFSKPAPAR